MPGFKQASDLNAWSALQDHHQKLGKDIVLKEYFKKDPQVRKAVYSCELSSAIAAVREVQPHLQE
jgi:hypothetical protein